MLIKLFEYLTLHSCNVLGTASFEIIWEDVKGTYTGLIPEDQFLNYIGNLHLLHLLILFI